MGIRRESDVPGGSWDTRGWIAVVGESAGFIVIGVDMNDLCALLPGRYQPWSQMGVRAHDVDAPKQNRSGLRQRFQRRRQATGTVVHIPTCRTCGGTNGLIEFGGAQSTEKAERIIAFDQSHRTRVVIGQDRSLAPLRDDTLETGCDLIERPFPSRCFKASLTFPADASQGHLKPIRMMLSLGIMRHFDASEPARDRMLARSLELDQLSVFDRQTQSAGIGAIEWTNRPQGYRQSAVWIGHEFISS